MWISLLSTFGSKLLKYAMSSVNSISTVSSSSDESESSESERKLPSENETKDY